MYFYNKMTGEYAKGSPKGESFGSTIKKPPKTEFNQSAIFDGSDWIVKTFEGEERTPESAREERDQAMQKVLWKAERHAQQKTAGLEADLTESQYVDLLVYIQALRDYPQQGSEWYLNNLPEEPNFIGVDE